MSRRPAASFRYLRPRVVIALSISLTLPRHTCLQAPPSEALRARADLTAGRRAAGLHAAVAVAASKTVPLTMALFQAAALAAPALAKADDATRRVEVLREILLPAVFAGGKVKGLLGTKQRFPSCSLI